MSKIVSSKVVKTGKLIDNYLVNFPQYINREKDSIYKLVIGQNISVFVVDIKEVNTKVKLPFYDITNITSDIFISWGDGSRIKYELGMSDFFVHTYENVGTYIINIFGETPDLYSIWYECKLTQEDLERISFLNQRDAFITEEQKKQLETLQDKVTLNNFFTSLVEVRKLSDTLTNLSAIFKNYQNLHIIPDNALPINVKNCDQLFAGCTGITFIPFEFEFPEGGTSFRAMFSGCTNLSTIFNQKLALSYGTENVNDMFAYTSIEQIPAYFFNNVTSSLTNMDYMFNECYNLFRVKSQKQLPYITSLNNTFHNCVTLNSVGLQFKNIYDLTSSFYNCISLTGIGNIQINNKTSSAYQTFLSCMNLEADVNDILKYNNLNNQILLSTFYYCRLLKGAPKEQYLWKAKNVTDNIIDTFYHDDSLANYNFIDPSWGGPFETDYNTGGRKYNLTYWYGSYEIEIDSIKDIYCLPLFKYQKGKSGDLTQYDFYINYGDDTAWLHIALDNTALYEDMWQNDTRSVFYGYPKTYKINFKNKYITANEPLEEQSDKYSAYDLLKDDFFYFIYKNITHKYQHIGKYKISIIGKVPRFYIANEDYITNKYLTNIITINRLPFTSLENAFRNAAKLTANGLPNESLLKLPVLKVTGNVDLQEMKLTNGCFDKRLEEDSSNIPPLFKIYKDNNTLPFK